MSICLRVSDGASMRLLPAGAIRSIALDLLGGQGSSQLCSLHIERGVRCLTVPQNGREYRCYQLYYTHVCIYSLFYLLVSE